MPASAIASLAALKGAISDLSLAHKRKLLLWLEAQIQNQEAMVVGVACPRDLDRPSGIAVPVKKGREVVEQKRLGTVVYQLEGVRCGKAGCRCATGDLHGPYWYAYQRKDGRLVSRYVGKFLEGDS